MVDQKQKASDGAEAYQAGRDMVVQHGVTPVQMKQILDAVANQFPAMAALALEVVNSRTAEFEKRFLETFGPGGPGKSEALKDPDFLYVLKESQHAYIRSGDEGVRDTLVDLIARRSQEATRNRLSLTLNNAIETAAALTKNEFAELSLCYLLRYTVHRGVRGMDRFVEYFRTTILPLLPDISKEVASYQYLEAHSCVTVSQLVQGNVIANLRGLYGGIFAKGFTLDQLRGCFVEERKHLCTEDLYCKCLNAPDSLQCTFLNREEFNDYTAQKAWTEAERNAVWGLIDSTTMNGDELVKHIENRVPKIKQLIEVWNTTPLGTLSLTTIGIAIGHSNLVRLCKFDADLAIWIK